MIEYLENLKKKFDEHMYLLLSMATGNVGRNKLAGEEKSKRIISSIGELYVTIKEVENRIYKLNNIIKDCKSEIEGTFYEDHLKKWEGSDFEEEYTTDSVYKSILGCWGLFPELELDEFAMYLIDMFSAMDRGLNKGLFNSFPGIEICKVEGGEMKKIKQHEMQADQAILECVELDNFKAYNLRAIKIKQIAENKGNLGEIIKLIG